MSEVQECRERLAPFCVGVGVDIGFGGEPIVPWAICLDRAENDPARAFNLDPSPTHLVGDAADLRWFRDCTLDWVFSSHVLEDFEDTRAVLREWIRVIRFGGNLVIYCPDQVRYEAHCKAAGSLPNQAHKHKDFSLLFVKKILFAEGYTAPDFILEYEQGYSFGLVVRK